jgi:preprotein translocase subunit SecG
MYQLIIVIHVLLGFGVIGLVLMQQGKGADAGAAFGTGSAGSVFGAQGAASFLSRSTAILASLFFITSLGLAVINGHRSQTQDIMSTPAKDKSDKGLPDVEGAQLLDASPVKVPAIKSDEKPVAEKSDIPSVVKEKPEDEKPIVAPVQQPDAKQELPASATENTPVAEKINVPSVVKEEPKTESVKESTPAVAKEESKAEVVKQAPKKKVVKTSKPATKKENVTPKKMTVNDKKAVSSKQKVD